MTRYGDEIIRLLSPKIGKSMAKSALEIQCKNCGITIDTIEPDNIGCIAERLYGPLEIFAGGEFAREIVEKLREL